MDKSFNYFYKVKKTFIQVKESILFSLKALFLNRLRTFLSLLGVSIGIFAIISVFTVVDSMERSIQSSVESLGENVIFVMKWPWEFGGDYPWWNYVKRPIPTLQELDFIKQNSVYASAACYVFSLNRTAENRLNIMENTTMLLASRSYQDVRDFEIVQGRYFTETEASNATPVCVVGDNVSYYLFGSGNPIGKHLKIMNKKMEVVGVFKREGESMIGNTLDNTVLIPVAFGKTFVDVRKRHRTPFIMVKAKENVELHVLKDELRSLMRSVRKITPKEESDFALNEVSIISKGVRGLFSTIGIAGGFIGFFAILVGGFGIANIMFVSVKERTQLIGIQKALGAFRYFILLQFLFESVFLCVLGGGVGMLIIYTGTLLIQNFTDFEIALSLSNVITGVVISIVIGLVSGITPALKASKLSPVEAMRKG